MHFFTEPSKLNPQGVTDPFGPVNGDESDKYRISSRHKVNADAKIFACQDAMMLVQPNVKVDGTVDSTKLNIVLKPIVGLDIPFSPVKYYIYRGVDINSFLSGSTITPNDPATKTEFITKFWKNWTTYTTNLGISVTPPPEPKSFGYDVTYAVSPKNKTLLEEMYNSSKSTNTAINDFQAIKVSEGEWIANILSTKEIEFEIIMDTDHITMDLKYSQLFQQIIDTTGLIFNHFIPSLTIISQREKILNYIDPAAFFGMHNNVGIYLGSWTGTTKNSSILKQKKDIITDALDTFLNKEVVYLDLRSERGYSYYYYQNYRQDFVSGSLLQWSVSFNLKTTSQTNFEYLDYASLHWPLVNLTNPPTNLSPIVQGEKIELKLLVKDNIEPLLFVENPLLLGAKNKNNFIDSKAIIDPSTSIVDSSLVITLSIPNFNNGTVDKNFPNHVKLQYFRKKDNTLSPNRVFKSKHYLDAAFGGIKIPDIGVQTPFQHIENTKKTYVTDGSSFGYVGKNGVLQTGTQILFYSEKDFSFQASTDTYPKFDSKTVPTSATDPILNLKNVILNKWKINDGTNDIDVLGIIGYSRTSLEITPKEDLLLLGMTKTELSDLNGLTGLSDLHHKYFVLTELFDVSGKRFVDTISSTPYGKFRVDIQGFDDSTGVVVTKDTSTLTNNVIVYGMTNQVLCTKDFGSASIVPITLPDPGTYTDHTYFHSILYDNTSNMVKDLFPTGIVKVKDNKMSWEGIPAYEDIEVGLTGELFYPVEKKNSKELSSSKDSYPMIVISHANGGTYTDYYDLCVHLAKNGFIVSSTSALIYKRIFVDVFKISDLPSSPIPTFPWVMSEIQYYFNLIGLPFVDLTKYYVIMDRTTGMNFIYGNDISNTTTYEKLMLLQNTTILKHPYSTMFGTNPSEHTYVSHRVLGWKKGVQFNIFVNPTPFIWKRKGSKPGTELGQFGLEWLKNQGSPGSFSAKLTKSGSRLVELTSTHWALNLQKDIKSAIDSATDISTISIAFPSGSINKYLGTIVDDIYYMLKIDSSSVSSCPQGSCVEIIGEVKNRQLEIKVNLGAHGARILSRANLIFPHLQIVKKYIEEKFNITQGSNRIQNNIGIIGHSRGAESVVRCASEVASGTVNSFDWKDFVNNGNDNRSTPKWNHLPNDLNNINAVISLAPTDASKDQLEKITENIPYYVIYGSCEGDVMGSPNASNPNRTSGFSIYDRTKNDTEKGMTFVYGATHKGFINNNNDFTGVFTSRNGNGGLTPIAVATQQNVAKAYMNAFMRSYLKNETVWKSYLHGDLIPKSIGYDELYQQFKNMETSPPTSKWINDFTTTMGTVTHTETLSHDQLINLDSRTPHDTEGIEVSWKGSKKADLLIQVSAGGKDISSYNYLSFRIGMEFNAAGTYADLSKLDIELKYIGMPSSGNYTRIINKEIPKPYKRDHNAPYNNHKLTKTAMMTIRIPLDEFQTNGVDLTKITHIQITFPTSLSSDGNVLIDDVEFTN